MLCCAVLWCAALCCAVLCCAVLWCAVLWCGVLCCAVLCYGVLCCAVLCSALLCCAVLRCVPLSISWGGWRFDRFRLTPVTKACFQLVGASVLLLQLSYTFVVLDTYEATYGPFALLCFALLCVLSLSFFLSFSLISLVCLKYFLFSLHSHPLSSLSLSLSLSPLSSLRSRHTSSCVFVSRSSRTSLTVSWCS